MSDYSVSCDGVAVDGNGAIFSIAVYTDGEGYNTYVHRSSDVAGRDGPNVQTELLDIQLWLTSIWRSEEGLLYVADGDGNVHRFGGGAWTVLRVSEQALTCVWGLSNDAVFAAGDAGIVYRWDGAAWTAISPSLGDVIFSIRGSGPRDLYVCGANGLFWHYNGGWTRIELPTNQRLVGLLVRNPKDVLVCGPGGTIFRGSVAEWEDVSQPGHDFYSIEEYLGSIYLAGGGEGVFLFNGASVTNIKDTIASYRLVSNATFLASAGDTVAARFDGANWFGARFS